MILMMTTRSSRFFVVLLHLVGVSTHLPSSFRFWSETGILGVNPLSIVLESSDPQLLLCDRAYLQPHWLQDTFDQACLDPMGGFSECGDATLWLVIPKQRRHARRRQWIRWATEEDNININSDGDGDSNGPASIEGYALQLVDDYNYPQNTVQDEATASSSSTSSSPAALSQDFAQKECLTRRRKDNQLVLAPCSQDRAWSWQFNQHGILYFEKPAKNSRNKASKNHLNNKRPLLKKQMLECIGRNATEAALVACDGEAPEIDLMSDMDERVIQIALVRQATAAYSTTTSTTSSAKAESSSSSSFSSSFSHRRRDSQNQRDAARIRKEEYNDADEQHPSLLPGRSASERLPSKRDIAHSHASTPAEHVELKKAPRFITTLSPNKAAAAREPSKLPSLHFLKDTNPILLAGGRGLANNNEGNTKGAPEPSACKSSILHEQSSYSSAPMKPVIRKIQVNPYVAASKDERWTDPLTGLVYLTDLGRYLGHDRKEVGRHTLTGVGQYMKTVFNIKVYGVAYYASKRDLLADPIMENYASLTSEELRERPDFYEVLRKMTSSTTDPNAGTFDRTLFLQTNMQLGTDTMRSSLDADWQMTREDKDLLIGSSMRPRPASPIMLSVIQSDDNPSGCSCGQIAPEEYQGNPDCCARGTELVFTWRKNGDLEVRLNGDLMDIFARPDIAAAIFFEYLRLDEPMSTDFLDHLVDGFPFLLGPLSQVKGVSSPAMSHPTQASEKVRAPSSGPVFKVLEGFGGVLSSHANSIAGFVHNGANELTSNAINTAKAVGDAAQKIGGEMERKRDLIGKHVSQFAQQTMSSFYGKDQKTLTVLPKWLGDMATLGDIPELEEESNSAPRGRLFKNTILRFFGQEPSPAAPDEIVPMIHPSTNSTQQFFFGMVHFYLLLMLIVSFPANLTTRTKIMVIRKTAQAISDSENSDSDGSTDSLDMSPQKSPSIDNRNGNSRFRPSFRRNDEACAKDGKIQKSLSYVL